MNPQLSIIIPAFNEEHRLEPTLRALQRYLRALPTTHELVVVDDGSTDGTGTLCERLLPEFPSLRCLRSDRNRGKGHAVRVGMLAARGEIRVMMDADGSTPPRCLGALMMPVEGHHADVSIGSRYAPGATVTHAQPLWRRVWSRLANRFNQALLLPGIVDTHCGFKAFSANAAQQIFSQAVVNGWSMDLEVLALARQCGFTLVEVPVTWADDARSTVRASHAWWRSIQEMLAIRWRLGRVVP